MTVDERIVGHFEGRAESTLKELRRDLADVPAPELSLAILTMLNRHELELTLDRRLLLA